MALASEKVVGLMTEDSKMMTSWEVGVEELVLEIGDHLVPQWELVAPVASEMGLPFVDLPWTSESQQKRKEHSGPDFSSNLEQLLLPSIK